MPAATAVAVKKGGSRRKVTSVGGSKSSKSSYSSGVVTQIVKEALELQSNGGSAKTVSDGSRRTSASSSYASSAAVAGSVRTQKLKTAAPSSTSSSSHNTSELVDRRGPLHYRQGSQYEVVGLADAEQRQELRRKNHQQRRKSERAPARQHQKQKSKSNSYSSQSSRTSKTRTMQTRNISVMNSDAVVSTDFLRIDQRKSGVIVGHRYLPKFVKKMVIRRKKNTLVNKILQESMSKLNADKNAGPPDLKRIKLPASHKPSVASSSSSTSSHQPKTKDNSRRKSNDNNNKLSSPHSGNGLKAQFKTYMDMRNKRRILRKAIKDIVDECNKKDPSSSGTNPASLAVHSNNSKKSAYSSVNEGASGRVRTDKKKNVAALLPGASSVEGMSSTTRQRQSVESSSTCSSSSGEVERSKKRNNNDGSNIGDQRDHNRSSTVAPKMITMFSNALGGQEIETIIVRDDHQDKDINTTNAAKNSAMDENGNSVISDHESKSGKRKKKSTLIICTDIGMSTLKDEENEKFNYSHRAPMHSVEVKADFTESKSVHSRISKAKSTTSRSSTPSKSNQRNVASSNWVEREKQRGRGEAPIPHLLIKQQMTTPERRRGGGGQSYSQSGNNSVLLSANKHQQVNLHSYGDDNNSITSESIMDSGRGKFCFAGSCSDKYAVPQAASSTTKSVMKKVGTGLMMNCSAPDAACAHFDDEDSFYTDDDETPIPTSVHVMGKQLSMDESGLSSTLHSAADENVLRAIALLKSIQKAAAEAHQHQMEMQKSVSTASPCQVLNNSSEFDYDRYKGLSLEEESNGANNNTNIAAMLPDNGVANERVSSNQIKSDHGEAGDDSSIPIPHSPGSYAIGTSRMPSSKISDDVHKAISLLQQIRNARQLQSEGTMSWDDEECTASTGPDKSMMSIKARNIGTSMMNSAIGPSSRPSVTSAADELSSVFSGGFGNDDITEYDAQSFVRALDDATAVSSASVLSDFNLFNLSEIKKDLLFGVASKDEESVLLNDDDNSTRTGITTEITEATGITHSRNKSVPRPMLFDLIGIGNDFNEMADAILRSSKKSISASDSRGSTVRKQQSSSRLQKQQKNKQRRRESSQRSSSRQKQRNNVKWDIQ